MCHIGSMPKVNMRELRDTKQLKKWLRAGRTVELVDRNKRIGRIVPDNPTTKSAEWPDFEARAKKILGSRILPGADLLIEERGRY
jgi:hypothetical protein